MHALWTSGQAGGRKPRPSHSLQGPVWDQPQIGSIRNGAGYLAVEERPEERERKRTRRGRALDGQTLGVEVRIGGTRVWYDQITGQPPTGTILTALR